MTASALVERPYKRPLPREKEVVIVGNGPSALTMGYLLLGHQAYYSGGHAGVEPHPDPLLHSLLSDQPENLEQLLGDVSQTNFSGSSRIVDPVARLLDSLAHPLSDVDPDQPTRLGWARRRKNIRFAILGKGSIGGIWAQLANSDMHALSHHSQLELPGLPFLLWRKNTNSDETGWRPGRKEVSQYYRDYAEAMGIARHCYDGIEVQQVRQIPGPFRYLVSGKMGLAEFRIKANHVVLATGCFTTPIPLQILGSHLPGVFHELEDLLRYNQPRRVLLVGTGLSAADALIRLQAKGIEVVHSFYLKYPRHTRQKHPLASCWKDDYPEYHRIYQMMKGVPCNGYEAFPDANLDQLTPHHHHIEASINFEGATHKRIVDSVLVLIGRRPNLDLMSSVSTTITPEPRVYAVGALAGSSFVRHILPSCLKAYRQISSPN